jgi:hypothetical protein
LPQLKVSTLLRQGLSSGEKQEQNRRPSRRFYRRLAGLTDLGYNFSFREEKGRHCTAHHTLDE